MTAHLPPESKSPSRRALLAGALGGMATWAAAAVDRVSPTDAAAGDPLILGSAANSAGSANTTLATNSSGTALLVTQNGSGTALRGSAVGAGSIAGFFTAQNGTGISGVTGNSASYAVFAQNNGAAGSAGALRASGGNNHGIVATTASTERYAVNAIGESVAINGLSHGAFDGFGIGVRGITEGSAGYGVVGLAMAGSGLPGQLVGGVVGISYTPLGYGVYGESATADGFGLYSLGNAHVEGDLAVTGAITAGTKDFRIDHPLDPAQKFLSHSCVESDERRTVYDGEVTLDSNGEATVVLAAWFGALNRNARIQLTSIATGAPNLHVKSEVSNNRFAVAGGASGQKVYWHLTATRQDAYAKAHPLAVEAAKTDAERGRYLHPEVHGKAASTSIDSLRARPAPAAATSGH